MALNDRITKLKPYLVAYNVSMEDGVQYAALKFPTNWAIPAEDIGKAYEIKVERLNGGVCFLSEIEKGPDVLFNAIDYVLDLNLKMQERVALLKEKVEELKKLFMKEDLGKLKTLEFVFKSKRKGPTPPKKEKTAQQSIEDAVEDAVNEAPIVEEPVEVKAEANDSGDLMDFVEKEIEK